MAVEKEYPAHPSLTGGAETGLHKHKLNDCAVPDSSVDFNKQQAIALVIENRIDDPSTPADGQIWLRTDL